MTDPTTNYPVIPPPPTSPWTTQDPYAPYARPADTLRPYEAYASVPPEPPADGVPRPDQPYEPYASAPPEPPYEPYAGGPGYGSPYGTPPGQAPPGQRPPAFWPLSIVGLLFSFLFGAIAIYFSVQVGRRWSRGDVEGAQRASRTARNLGIVAIVVGVVGSVILLAVDAR